jgi:hypothetical protein
MIQPLGAIITPQASMRLSCSSRLRLEAVKQTKLAVS